MIKISTKKTWSRARILLSSSNFIACDLKSLCHISSILLTFSGHYGQCCLVAHCWHMKDTLPGNIVPLSAKYYPCAQIWPPVSRKMVKVNLVCSFCQIWLFRHLKIICARRCLFLSCGTPRRQNQPTGSTHLKSWLRLIWNPLLEHRNKSDLSGYLSKAASSKTLVYLPASLATESQHSA